MNILRKYRLKKTIVYLYDKYLDCKHDSKEERQVLQEIELLKGILEVL